MKRLLGNALMSVARASRVLAKMSVHGVLMAGVLAASVQAQTLPDLINEDFDGVTAPDLPAGWTTQSSGLGADWMTGTDGTWDTQPNHAFVPNPDGISDKSLVSPPFVPTSGAVLTFQQYYELYGGGNGGLAVLEIAIDGVAGGAFQDILAAGGSFISGGYGFYCANASNPLHGRQGWSGISGHPVVVALPQAAAGNDTRLRWRLGTAVGNPPVDRGWWIDSIGPRDETIFVHDFECAPGLPDCVTGGAPGTHTDLASFLQNVQPGYYQESFTGIPVGVAGPSLSFASNGFAYTVTASGPGSNTLFNAPGVISTSSLADRLVVTFIGAPVTAVGGNFWGSDQFFVPNSGVMTLTLSDGTVETYSSTGPDDFRGFVTAAPITSIAIDVAYVSADSWPTMDNLIVGRR